MRVKLIEKNRAKAEQAAESLSKTTILHGDALDFELLDEAGISGVKHLFPSNDDEVNILGALLAKQHGAERTVALVNSPNYGLLTGRLGIDAVVNPRESPFQLFYPMSGLVYTKSILDGFGEVLEFVVRETSAAVGKKTEELNYQRG